MTPEGALRVEGTRPNRRAAKQQPKADATTATPASADAESDPWRTTPAAAPSSAAASPSAAAYTFSRSFSLPEDAVADEVSASLDKGVLTVTVPRRAPEPKPEARRVRVSAQPKASAAQWPADRQQEGGSEPLQA